MESHEGAVNGYQSHISFMGVESPIPAFEVVIRAK